MSRWARKLAWLLAPIGERLLSHILKAPKIHGDETPVTLLGGKDGRQTAYFWVYLHDGRSSGDMSPPAVAFRFTSRGGKHPAAHLAGYRGYLQADGYAGYNGLYRDPKTRAPHDIVEVGCWAHARRKFTDVLEKTPSPDDERTATFLGLLVGFIETDEQIEKREDANDIREKHAVLLPRALVGIRNWP